MKLPRVRFTVRRMMVAVAIVALSLGAIRWVVEMRHRSAAYQRRALEYAVSIRCSTGILVRMPDGRWVDRYRYQDENDRRDDAWARQLAAKYRRLSYTPWLAAGPDPPRPVRLAHPRNAFELPAKVITEVDVDQPSWDWVERPPAWTFLWTWPRRY